VISRRAWWALLYAAFALPPAFAQPGVEFPVKPVTLVVPFPAGGPADALARQLQPLLRKALGQPVVVENVGGASGRVGTLRVAKAAADGYTLVLGHAGTHAANAALFPTLGYDPAKDFVPVAKVASMPSVLLVKNSLPVASVDEFIEYVRKNEKTINIGTAGNGTASHLAAAMFFGSVNIQPIYIPYKGTGPAATDLMGGVLDAMFDTSISAVPVAQGGRARALMVTSSTRVGVLPAVPTAQELGHTEFTLEIWYGVFAPKGTPLHIVARLGVAVREVLGNEPFRRRLEDLGVQATHADASGAEQLGRAVSEDVRRYTELVKSQHIVAE
jgi:tripartite-type tricarboxylate transporter receptor subunit TctC